MCQDNRSFEELSNKLELIDPRFSVLRSKLLRYLCGNARLFPNELFTLRMPDKMEIKKHSSTVIFLRKMMEAYGYELVSRDNPNPPSEMESLMNWMLDDR